MSVVDRHSILFNQANRKHNVNNRYDIVLLLFTDHLLLFSEYTTARTKMHQLDKK